MTLPTLTFAYITDDTARALYGSFRPELWFAVEACLMANPNWANDLYMRTTDDIASAVHASARLAAITGQNDGRYSAIVQATAAFVAAWAIENTPSDLESLALSNTFELALFGTLVILPTLKLYDLALLALDISGLAYWAIELWTSW